MKNQPLTTQIWILLTGITLGIVFILAFIIPLTLRNFFTREIFENIENAQEIIWQRGMADLSPLEREHQRINIRSVSHILYVNSKLITNSSLPIPILKKIYRQALKQEVSAKEYSLNVRGDKIFYIIRIGTIAGRNVVFVSYMWDTYLKESVKTLFIQILKTLFLVILILWFPSIWAAKRLVRPLIQMEQHVKKIAERDWHEPLLLDRKDEIGRLSASIERMRERLVKQDEAQQTLLQHISHELKTPVMIIRSYASSIQDGIYPKGDLKGSVQVIEEESERLEKRIRDLLYLTKLDYLATKEPNWEPIHLKGLVETVIDRLRWRRDDLEWIMHLDAATILGDPEQWKIVFENLLDNQLRYAQHKIKVSLKEERNSDRSPIVTVQIWNDGPQIDPKTMETLFHQFRKGYKGEFGLGLAIVQRIITLHHATIWAENEEKGVSFLIRIPLTQPF
jgi:two-component system sensor histidine kinase CssS